MGQAKRNRNAGNTYKHTAPAGAFKLFSKEQVFHPQSLNGIPGLGTVIQLPEGMVEYRDDVVNLMVYAPWKQQPEFYGNTGYGCSYLSKIASGTKRMQEWLIEAYAGKVGDNDAWMLQITITNKGQPKKEVIQHQIERCIASLPEKYKTIFNTQMQIAVAPLRQLAGFVG